MLLAALISGCSCGGSGDAIEGGGGRDEFLAALQGTFASCRLDGPSDIREVVTLGAASLEVRIYGFESADGTCSGPPTLLPASFLGTYAVGAARTVAAPGGGGTVTAYEVDLALPGETSYSIAWVKTSVTPNLLYVGDDTGAQDGSTPALRPTALQSLARARLATPAAWPAVLQGAWRTCRSGGQDESEWTVLSGADFTSRTYLHATTDGTCGGRGVLAGGGSGGFQLGAAVATDLGGFPVTAHQLDLLDPAAPTTPFFYTLVWVDAVSDPQALYAGDAGGTLDGSTPALRPTALQPAPMLRGTVTEPVYPAALAGTWRACTTEDRGAGPRDFEEVFVITGTALTVTEREHASVDGTCAGLGTVTNGPFDATFTLAGSGPALLTDQGKRPLQVTAQWIDLALPGPQTLYTLVHLDPTAPQPTLYLGDESFAPGLDGSTAAKRPTKLQDWKPRYRD